MKEFLFIILLLFISSAASAQENPQKENLTFEAQLVMDNDLFTLDLQQDQYYSSGIYPGVRWLGDSSGHVRIIHSAQLNHRIFTPSWVGWKNESLLDRPYAGQLSASMANEYYFASNQYLKIQVELGWMGPGAKVGEAQSSWHRWFGMPQPRGWHYQINNTPIVNGYIAYLKPLFTSYSFDLASETNLGFGTVFNYARQEIMIRFGKLRPLLKSAYSGASFGGKRIQQPQKQTVESYFFYAPGLEYVLYNATIEGNLMGKKSDFTDQQINLIFQNRAGVMFSWPRFDLGFTAYWRTRENEKATAHKYASIRMNQRF